MGVYVESAVAEPVISGFVIPSSPEECFDACEQLADTERFGDVIVGAEVKAQDDIGFLTLGGEHDDWCIDFLLADEAADFVAVDFWQHGVKDDEVWLTVQCGV